MKPQTIQLSLGIVLLVVLYVATSLAVIDRQAPIYHIISSHQHEDGATYVSAQAQAYHLRLGDGPMLQFLTAPIQALLLLHDGPNLLVDDLYMTENTDPYLQDALRAHALNMR